MTNTTIDREIEEAKLALEEALLLENTEDLLICECSCVGLKEIQAFCEKQNQISLNDLKNSLGVGDGCGKCIKNQGQWIHLIQLRKET